MPPVDDDMSWRMRVAEAFGFRYHWLWGDSMWTLDGNWSKLVLHRLPQSQFSNSNYHPGPVWTSQSETSELTGHYEFARSLRPSFLETCQILGYDAKFEHAPKPLKPIYRRLKNYSWHLVQGDRIYKASLFEHFESLNMSKPQAEFTLREMPTTARIGNRDSIIVKGHFDRKTRELYYTMFAHGQLDELRMIAAL